MIMKQLNRKIKKNKERGTCEVEEEARKKRLHGAICWDIRNTGNASLICKTITNSTLNDIGRNVEHQNQTVYTQKKSNSYTLYITNKTKTQNNTIHLTPWENQKI